MTEPPRVNPYHFAGKWYWYDETYDIHGPYKSQHLALTDLLKYMYWLDHGPTVWQRIWWPIRRFLKDESTIFLTRRDNRHDP